MTPVPTYNFFHRIFLALSGIYIAFKRERHLKFHALMGVCLIFPLIWVKVATYKLILLIIMIGLLIVVELINTAIETIVDMITKQYSIRAKIAKDISSGAVLIVAILTASLGMFIYAPNVYNLVIGVIVGY